MKEIHLSHLKLQTFTEQDAKDYCLLNNINPYSIKELYLVANKLTDISGSRIFKNLLFLSFYSNRLKDISVLKHLKNLNILILRDNKIKDISVIQNFKDLKTLSIDNLELESDQIKYIKSLNNLEILYCYNGFKDMSVLKQLYKNIEIIKLK